MLAPQVGDDRLVHPVATDADRARIDDIGKAEHGDLGRAAADVHDHGAGRIGDRHARADRRRDGFRDQARLPRARRQDRLANGALFHGRRAVGDADDDLGLGEGRALVDLADEVLDHLLGHVEIGNDPVAHGADGLDRAGRPAQHQLGVLAEGQRLLQAVLDLVGDDRRLVQHDALART
jgi:hypothetical protein